MNAQEKLDEIHAILVKWESRRKWKNFFSWIYRIIILGLLVIAMLFPNIFTDFFIKITTPIINSAVEKMIESQKENLSNLWDNLSEKAQNILQNNFSSRNENLLQ